MSNFTPNPPLPSRLPEDYEPLEDVEPASLDEFIGAESPQLEARGSKLRERDPARLPRALDWRGKDLSGTTRQVPPRYGSFDGALPRGLCLHFTVSSVWYKTGNSGDSPQQKFRHGIARKTQDSILYARQQTRNNYYLLSYDGQHHQDCDVSDCGIHGHSANSYTQGVEIVGAGKLMAIRGEYHRSFDLRQDDGRYVKVDGHYVLRNARQPPVPAWARRTVATQQGNINPGTYMLFSPAQVEGICRLHADLMYVDADRGIYRSEHQLGVSGVTSHDLHSNQKNDVGGALFTELVTFGGLLARYIRELRGDGPRENLIDEARHAAAFTAVILEHPEYRQVYADWEQDTIPIWA